MASANSANQILGFYSLFPVGIYKPDPLDATIIGYLDGPGLTLLGAALAEEGLMYNSPTKFKWTMSRSQEELRFSVCTSNPIFEDLRRLNSHRAIPKVFVEVNCPLYGYTLELQEYTFGSGSHHISNRIPIPQPLPVQWNQSGFWDSTNMYIYIAIDQTSSD